MSAIKSRRRPAQPRLPRIPEKAVQASIVKLLRSIGAAVYVLGTTRRRGDYQGTMQTPGIPDLYVVFPSRYKDKTGKLHRAEVAPDHSFGVGPVHVWVEVKSKAGRLSSAQQRFKNWHLFTGPEHIVGGIDEVIAWLKCGGWVK